MMRVEPCEEYPNVNIVLRSGIAMSNNKGKHPKNITWVCTALEKEAEFDLEHACEMFMEEKRSFTEASTSGSRISLFMKWTLLCL